MYPIDKLGLINQALALTGDNLCAVPEDGSDEWATASAAYEKAIEFMFEDHDWKQITNVVTLNSTGTAPADDMFDTAYAKPPDCVHVIWVRINDLPVVYQILNNQIVLNQAGQAGVATLKYVASALPTSLVQMTRMFMTALETFIEAGIYQGVHEDLQAAKMKTSEAMAVLDRAKTRSDQEQPKRAMFNSRYSASRRVRRPFPTVPPGWGGSGNPG